MKISHIMSVGTFKRISALFFSLIFLIGYIFCGLVCTSVTGTAMLSSNDRRYCYLKWASGASLASLDSDMIDALTDDDLRMLGVYLSNFYIPFHTCLGQAQTLDGTSSAASCEQSMASQLAAIGFSTDTAQALVEKLWSLAKSTMQPLYIGWNLYDSGSGAAFSTASSPLLTLPSKEYPDGIDSGTNLYYNTDTDTVATYYDFLSWYQQWHYSTVYNETTTKQFNCVPCLYWLDGDTPHEVFDYESYCIYCWLNRNVGYNSGYGSAFFSITEDEYNAYANSSTLTTDDKRSITILGSRMYVDIFGDILMNTGRKLEVVFPACDNPYSWTSLAGTASDGTIWNLVTAAAYKQAADGIIAKDTTTSTYTASFSTKDGDGSLMTLSYMRFFEGSSDYKLSGALRKSIHKFSNLVDQNFFAMSWVNGIFTKKSIDFPAQTYIGVGPKTIYSGHKFSYTPTASFDTLFFFSEYKNMEESLTDSTLSTTTIADTASTATVAKSAFVDLASSSGYSCAPVSTDNKAFYASMFLTYLYMFFSDSSDSSSANTVVGTTSVDSDDTSSGPTSSDISKITVFYDGSAFPTSENTIDWSAYITASTVEDKQDLITNWTFNLLNPKDSTKAFTSYVRSKLIEFALSESREESVADTSSDTIAVSKYMGFSGVLTTPTLSDSSFTSGLLTSYEFLIPFLFVFLLLLAILRVIMGKQTLVKALGSSVLYVLVAYVPIVMTTFVVSTTNRILGGACSNKFMYWVLYSHEASTLDANTLLFSDSNDTSSSATAFSLLSTESNASESSVRLKWMCPKKVKYLTSADRNSLQGLTSSTSLTTLAMGLLQGSYSGESYLSSTDADYLYRNYIDIGSWANYTYSANSMLGSTDTGYFSCLSYPLSSLTSNSLRLEGTVGSDGNPCLYDTVAKMYAGQASYSTSAASDAYNYLSYSASVGKGFTLGTTGLASQASLAKNNMRWYLPISEHVISTLLPHLSDDGFTFNVDSAGTTTLWGVPDTYYETPRASFFTIVRNASLQLAGTVVLNGAYKWTDTDKGLVSPENDADTAFALYTESPFYYFSWNLRDQVTIKGLSDSATPYKDLFLGTEGDNYFLNFSDSLASSNTAQAGYGDLRDYADMKSLFTVVIPFLKSCNDMVQAYGDEYGLTTYADIPLEYDSDGDIVLSSDVVEGSDTGFRIKNTEYAREYWQNAMASQLFNIYSPWVDTMYDCSYADPTVIKVNGVNYTVEDPLNPSSYYQLDSSGNIVAGRPMVFSESEAHFWGLDTSDLTAVERKILEFESTAHSSLLDVMNYYTFDPTVVNTASAMLETFAFNGVFSESGIGTSHELYPQNYELKSFTFEGLSKQIFAKSLGVTAVSSDSTDSLYKILNSSSLFTVFLYTFASFLGSTFCPLLRYLLLIVLFLLGVLMTFRGLLHSDDGDDTRGFVTVFIKSFVKYLLLYATITLVSAFILFLSMSSGESGVVTSSAGLSWGSPSFTVLFILLVFLIEASFYLILSFKSVRSLYTTVKGTLLDIKGAFSSAAKSVMGHFSKGQKGTSDASVVSGESESTDKDALNKSEDSPSSDTEDAQNSRVTAKGLGGDVDSSTEPAQQGAAEEPPASA